MTNYIELGIEETTGNVQDTKKRKRKDPKSAARPSIGSETLKRLGEGCHESFEAVFHTFYYRVSNFIMSLTKDRDVAEELSQQVFVNVWENRATIDPTRNFNSYIYVLAKNAALAYFRTNSIHKTIEKQVFTDEPVISIESEMFAREAQLLIELTVGNMPRQRKMVYEMSQVGNKSNNEIAEELNITKKAVEKHLRLAYSDIRSVLQRFISLLVF